MTNKKIASEIAIGIILLIAIVIGGIFWVQSKESIISDQPLIVENQKPVEEKGAICTQDAKLCDDGSYVSRTGPKCEFAPCPSSQSVKDGYKLIEIKNPSVQFSFNVPEKWLTETRRSGEKQLTSSEMRDFLTKYIDMPSSEINKLNDREIGDLYIKTDNKVVVSVSNGSYISYTDTSWQQIDFYVLKDFNGLKTYFNDVKNSRDSVAVKENVWSAEKVDDFEAEVVTFPTDIDENGNEAITKGGTGGKIYFIKFNNGKDMFIVNKQSKGDEQFEKDFEYLIQTLKIKAL